mgnify:CR=1 FL=1
MTKRLNGATGDSVSILGYGCMRLPTKALVSGNEADDEIDQNAVNESVDYAIAHGVNYFDTSPAYCKGHSEEAMGVADLATVHHGKQVVEHGNIAMVRESEIADYLPAAYGFGDIAERYRALHRLQILHAVPLRCEYPRNIRPL